MTDSQILFAAQQHMPAPVGSDAEEQSFTAILPTVIPVILPLVLDLVKGLVAKCNGLEACATISEATADRSGKSPVSARVRRQLIAQMRQRNQAAVEREIASRLPPNTKARPRVIARARNRVILDAVQSICCVQHTDDQVRKAVARWQA
jgi:hypothetical protein